MEKKKDKIILGLILVIIVLLGVIAFLVIKYKKKEENTTEPSTQEKENQTKEQSYNLNDFEFTLENTRFENGTSTFTIKVTNKTNEAKQINQFKVIIKNETGEELVRLIGIVNEEIVGNGTTTVTCSYGGDLSNYNTLEYEL